jgi:hipA domain protein
MNTDINMLYNIVTTDGTRFKEITNRPTKGARVKKLLDDTHRQRLVFLKYCAVDRDNKRRKSTELASEKIACEIAKVIGYKCADIELAKDQDGELCVLNYSFLKPDESLIEFASEASISQNGCDRKEKYTIQGIKRILDTVDEKLYSEFIGLQVFDALIGESDRHEENWGYIRTSKSSDIVLAPFYDNGDSLMHNINENRVEEYINDEAGFLRYIHKSKTKILDNNGHKIKHFQLIDHLISENPVFLRDELQKTKRLTDDIIKDIIYGIPDEYLPQNHKDILQRYISIRRDILLIK